MRTEAEFEVVTELAQLEKYMHALTQSPVLAIDTETTGLDPLRDTIRLIQVAAHGCPVLVLDLWGIASPVQEFINHLLAGQAVKVFQNAKFDLKFLRRAGWPAEGRVFDTYVAGHLLRQRTGLTRFGLDVLASHYLGVEVSKEQQTSSWSGTLSQDQYEYAARDAAVLLPLREAMISDLQAEDLLDIAKLEFGCLHAVVEMELTGVALDLDRWKQLGERFEQQKEAASLIVREQLCQPARQLSLFGDDREELNLDSQPQVLKALKAQGIPVRSTSRNQLTPLAYDYPVIRHLLEYRKAAKALQAFIYSIPETVHPVTGRIHPQYHQMGASTGRFSCGHPNLQQIPRSPEFRSCFVAQSGHQLVIADYSQIELRVVAEISRDETMIRAYTTGQDLHQLTASLVANKPLAEVTKQERQAAKAVNFGLVYAMGARGLQVYAQTTYGVSMTLEEAELFRKRFFEAYAGVAAWHLSVKRARERVTRTLGGRKYRWKEDAGVTGLYNWPVQGTAADIVKQAMADLAVNLKGSSAKIVGMIHDEIILETRQDEASGTAEILKETMEQAGARFLSRVPVVAETLVAQNWAEK